jgi:pilus assembly protein CpaC
MMLKNAHNIRKKITKAALLAALACTVFSYPAVNAQDSSNLLVPVHRSALINVSQPMSEVMVADPDIADVHVHNSTNLTVVGKSIGRTNLRVFDKEGKVERDMDIVVGYDLPAIRKALKNFLPDENIAVEMINTSIALTGNISNASNADKAMKIVTDFVSSGSAGAAAGGGAAAAAGGILGGAQAATTGADAAGGGGGDTPKVVNMMQVVSGQQVMLRVRVGEINRTALKTLGVDLNYVSQASGTGLVAFGTGGGIASLVAAGADDTAVSPGVFLLPGGQTPTNTRGLLTGRWQPNGPNGNTTAGMLKALENDGLFKVLAEPNLVAVSGEEAEFLAGGEIPIPVVQGTGTTNVTIEYKPFGVAVKFTPFVLSENRIRMAVQPEVSEVSTDNALVVSGFSVPSINTRRARTTVELAPGESFMIAGLIKDQMRATIDQLPGVKELPVLGALFRSTEFQRNETELVIAVTPYVVDPLKNSDIKLPTDNLRPASQMDMFFFGALGGWSGRSSTHSKPPGLEGPVGFMVD